MSKICKFGSHLKELRIHLCQTGAASQGVRDFIQKHYVEIKSKNPKFPILIRECSGVQPRLWARYEGGRESSASVSNMDVNGILSQLENIVRKV